MTTATTIATATFADDAVEARDAAAIRCHDWPDRPLTHPTAADRDDHFQVVFRQSALDAIHLHGQTRTDVELCGVLIGTGCRDAHGPYLLVEHAIAGTAASSRSTNVTFTADTWQQIQTVMDRDHPDKKMVGWYHTHPGFGIFLSDMDLFICDNFFNLPWQVAFVYDPVGGDEGNFVWRAGRPVREPVLLEDDVTPRSAAVPLMPVSEAMTGSDPASVPGPYAEPYASAYAEPFVDPPLSARDAAALDLPPGAAAALQSQAVELMARVRLLERRLKLLAFSLLSLAVFVAVVAAMLVWSTLNAPPPQPARPPALTQMPSQQSSQPPSQPPSQPRPTPAPAGPANAPGPVRGH